MDADDSKVWTSIASLGKAIAGLTAEERERAVSGFLSGLGRSVPSPASVPSTGVSPPPGNTSNAGNTGTKPSLSVVELVKEKTPRTNPQTIATFAYYRQHHEGKDTFSSDDLLPYFAKAKMAAPTNYRRDFGRAIAAGLIHEDGETAYLTQSGGAAVAAGFQGNSKIKATRQKKKKKKKDETKGKS